MQPFVATTADACHGDVQALVFEARTAAYGNALASTMNTPAPPVIQNMSLLYHYQPFSEMAESKFCRLSAFGWLGDTLGRQVNERRLGLRQIERLPAV